MMIPLLRRASPWLVALLGSSWATAQNLVDLSFAPDSQSVEVGESLVIQLFASSQDDTPANIGALDAVLAWDPAVLRLVSSDESNASYNWFQAGFFTDPDGINADLSDGDAIFTALAQFSGPAVAPPPPGILVTEFHFEALTASPGSSVSFTPTLGNFGRTQVIDFFIAGLDITGDISSQATVSVNDPVSEYCEGSAAVCPCGNGSSGPQGCTNSSGQGASISTSGSTSVSADDLILRVDGVPAFQFGIVYTGQNQFQLPFGDGLRCVGAGPDGVVRFPVTNSGSNGTLLSGPGLLTALGSFNPIEAGETWNFQGWYRDPVGPCGAAFNLSNALTLSFVP